MVDTTKFFENNMTTCSALRAIAKTEKLRATKGGPHHSFFKETEAALTKATNKIADAYQKLQGEVRGKE